MDLLSMEVRRSPCELSSRLHGTSRYQEAWLRMRFVPDLPAIFLMALIARAGCQTPTAPTPQPAHIAGTVTDATGDLIPGATVTIEAGSAIPQLAVADDNGAFEIDNLTPGTTYQVKVT